MVRLAQCVADSDRRSDMAMSQQLNYFALLFLIFLFLAGLAGCTGHGGLAPVSDRTGRAANSGDKWITVRKGDTLFSISFAYGYNHLAIAKLNRIKPPYTIYPGQRIKLSGEAPKSQNSKKTSTQKNTRKWQKSTKKARISRHSASISPSYKGSTIQWAWPANGKVVRTYSASAPQKKGIAISGKHGQVIKAAAKGKVVYSGNGLLGYGNLIIMKHSETYLSAYAHSLKVYVKEGQMVKKGQKVASMGRNESGDPMLHFEIRRHGKPVNPLRYLPRR